MAFRILQSDEWFVDRIIAQAGVARATLFRHFPTKDDLIAAYLERRALRARDTLSALRDDYRDEPDRVLAAIADVVDDYRDQPGFRGCEIINATAELSDPAHPARRLAIDHRRCALVGASRSRRHRQQHWRTPVEKSGPQRAARPHRGRGRSSLAVSAPTPAQ